MKYSDIYRLYSTSQPKDAIHQALREVSVDDSDEQYEDRSPLHLACQYGDTEGSRYFLNVMPNPTRRMQTVPPRFISSAEPVPAVQMKTN